MAAEEVQNLLRFLTTDAKVPLATALSKIGALRASGLNTADTIGKADATSLKSIFDDDRILKQVNAAAKRVSNSKKRSAPEASLANVTSKRSKTKTVSHDREEADLALPTSEATADELSNVQIETNRAPLCLAFAVTALKYTMPDQPLSSRLSLANSVMKANALSKAKHIGISSGKSAEDEGWAQGQPMLKVMDRDITVMRRQYNFLVDENDSQKTVEAHEDTSYEAFWGLDLEALRKSNSPLAAGRLGGSAGPPIHRPEAARSYLLRSMSLVESAGENQSQLKSKPKQTQGKLYAEKEQAAAMVLKTIDLLCQSWAPVLSKNELDKRAWSWYVSTRPEVRQGQAGWGQKGTVRLADILKLRRKQSSLFEHDISKTSETSRNT